VFLRQGEKLFAVGLDSIGRIAHETSVIAEVGYSRTFTSCRGAL
jgi:hypothetical protein